MTGTYIESDVRTTVRVEGTEFVPTEVEVVEGSGNTDNSATIKGFTEDPASLSEGAGVTVSVAGDTIFRGDLLTARLEPEKIVRIEAYGLGHRLRRSEFSLNYDGGQTFQKVINGIVSGTEFAGLIEIGDEVPTDTEISAFKTTNNDAFDALKELASRVGAQLFVGRNNKLRIAIEPESKAHIAEFPLDVTAGEDSTDDGFIIVGGTGAGSVSPATAAVQNEINNPLQAGTGDPDSGAKVHTLTQRNIATQGEAGNVANKLAVELNSRKQDGKIEHVGVTDATVFDTIFLRNLSLKAGAELAEARYQIDTVKHTITPSDGYRTEFSVHKPYDVVASDITLARQSAVQFTYSEFTSTLEDADPLIPTGADTSLGEE